MNAFDALSFDCYGTLIDWYAGVRAAARAAPGLQGIDIERFVRDRDAADRELIQGDYRPYARIVAESARRAALLQQRELDARQAAEFAASMRGWPPFAESRAALARLEARFKLGVLSNVETSTLEASIALLGAKFDPIVTAQQVRSYKPRHEHWREAIRRLKLPPSRVLHVGCSMFHDIRPASALGFATAFVDRECEGLAPGDAPTLHVPDLTTLCAKLGV